MNIIGGLGPDISPFSCMDKDEDNLIPPPTTYWAFKGTVHPQKIFFKYVMLRTVTKNSTNNKLEMYPISYI